MTIELGKTYKAKDGYIFKCSYEEVEDLFVMTEVNEGFETYYLKDGRVFEVFPIHGYDYSQHDIIEEVV